MNLRTRALVGLLCIGLAQAQLNFRPEFISAGQGFRAAGTSQSNTNSVHSLIKRQAQGGGDPTDVIPHDNKKQTTYWWVAPETPFKATKIGGGVQKPPDSSAENADAGAVAGAGGAAGNRVTSEQQVLAGDQRSIGTQTSSQGGIRTFGRGTTISKTTTSTTRNFQSGAAGGAVGTAAAGAAAGVGAAGAAGGIGVTGINTQQQTNVQQQTNIQRTAGGGVAGGGISGVGIAGVTGTSSTRQTQGTTVAGGSTTQTQTRTTQAQSQFGQGGPPGAARGGVSTATTFRRTQTSTTTGIAPGLPPGSATATGTNTFSTQARTNTAVTRTAATGTTATGTTTTGIGTTTTGTGTTATGTTTSGQQGGVLTNTAITGTTTSTATGVGTNTPDSPNQGSSTVTRQQESSGGFSTHKVTTGVQLTPFFKKTSVTSSGYDYPVPCLEPQICTPRDYCINGEVQEAQLGLFDSTKHSCNSQTEQCCSIVRAPPTQCPDNTYVCVSASLCNNGQLTYEGQNSIYNQQQNGFCYSPDVCCKAQGQIAESTVLTDEGYINQDPSPANDTPIAIRPPQPRPTPPGGEAPPPLPPIGCSAAMNCTERQFCSSTGVISKTPVNLTPEQELYRVPVTECRSPDQGFTGVCCRDPDYVDPWPVGMLGLYNPEILPFDDGSYKPNGNGANGNAVAGNANGQARNEAIQASQSRITTAQTYGPNQLTSAGSQTRFTQSKTQYTSGGTTQLGNGATRSQYTSSATQGQYNNGVTAAASSQATTAIRRQQTTSVGTTALNGGNGDKRFSSSGLQFVNSGNTQFKPFQKQTAGQCAPRNYNTQPRGAGQWDTGFGEFPWMAMVILESNKTLLCGGAIISENTVVTAANCVNGLNPRDIMIKGGEWRLGVDAEPKTFQIVRVKDVVFHPAYNPSTLNYDVAMLVLEDRLRFDTHIGSLCLDENDVVPSASYENCVTTGWGREVLRVHIGNALMRYMPISLLSESESQRQLQTNGFAAESHICGRPAADACDVDIGSALACADTSGTYYLKGVYSQDNGCGRPDQIVSFSNIDVQWIKQVLKNPSQFITPVPNYQTAANSPVISTVQQPTSQGPNYGKAYLPPY